MSQTVDAVRELIMQDRYVTYRAIEASLDISSTSILQYCMNTRPKKYLFSGKPAQCDNRSKKVRVDWCKEMLEKYDGDASKDVYKIVRGDKSWI